MTALEMIAAYLGEVVASPQGLGGQCVDLANLYLLNVLGVPEQRRNAVDWQRALIPGMAWVGNSPTNYPALGSLVVWAAYGGYGIGQYGHIAIALAADDTRLVTADQDWPLGAGVSLTLHDYMGVAGWLARPAGRARP